MAGKDDIVDFANRGMDQIFPGRKIARMAGITSAAQALGNAAKSSGATKEDVDKAMAYGSQMQAAGREVPRLWEETINKAIMPKYAKAVEDKIAAQVADRPKNKGKFDPQGMDKEYKKGGKVGSASKRADGIAERGRTRGKMY